MTATVVVLSRNDGTDGRLAKECASLRSAGFDVTLLGWDWGQSGGAAPPPALDGVDIKLFRTARGRSLRGVAEYVRFAVSEIRRAEPAVVHAVNEELMLVALLARFGRRRFVLVGDLFDSLLLRSSRTIGGRFIWALARLSHYRVDRLIVTDEPRYRQLPDGSKGKAVIVPNYPVDPGRSLAAEWPEANGVRIFAGGSLSIDRGLETVLSAVRAVPGARIICAGWLYDEYSRRFAAEPEVDYRGVVSPREALELASQCHIVFGHYAPKNANNRLASPNKVYDSMSVGRPLLINSEVQLSEWVEAEGLGLATGYGDVDALVEAIRVLSEPTQWQKQAVDIRSRFEAGFSWSEAERGLLDLYKGSDVLRQA